MLTPEQRRKFERDFPKLRETAPHLTEPAWQYAPYPGRFEAHYCVYCGERARTYDAIPDKLYVLVEGRGGTRMYVLVAACDDCQHYLNGMPVSNMNRRKEAMLIELRRRYNHSRGPRSGTPKIVLQRRISYLLRNMKSGDERQRIGSRAPKPTYPDKRS